MVVTINNFLTALLYFLDCDHELNSVIQYVIFPTLLLPQHFNVPYHLTHLSLNATYSNRINKFLLQRIGCRRDR